MGNPEFIIDLLKHGGVDVSSDDPDPLAVLESWLGMPEGDRDTDLMEDAAPFDADFYQTLEDFLIHSWKPDLKDQPKMHLDSNPFLDLGIDPKEMTIYKALESVRVTRLLRCWMELNILGNKSMLDSEEEAKATLSKALLSHARQQEIPSGRKIYPVIQAVYHHVEQLPFLQSQLYFYTQSLMRNDQSMHASGKAVSDAQSRLKQFKATQDVSARLNQQWEDHIKSLEHILGEWYSLGSVDMRRQARIHLGSVWAQFVTRSGAGGASGVKIENTTSSGIRMTLQILHRILLGTSNELQKAHEHLLHYHLIPLHRPSTMVLWRDQTSLLELYHEPLVKCIAILLQKKPEWIPHVISALMEPDVWNQGGNTPKLVLLLHEIDTYIGILTNPGKNPQVLGETWPTLLRMIGGCMASDHSRLAERALTFFKTKNFLSLVEGNFERSLRILLPFLVRKELPWNPTVRKMTYSVLKTLQDYNKARFQNIAEECFPSNDTAIPDPSPARSSSRLNDKGSAEIPSSSAEPGPKDFSLKSAMGGWKPPVSRSSRAHGTPSAVSPSSSRTPRPPSSAPPLGVTGVAPWSIRGTPSPAVGRKNPPLGITGVAPWAVQKKPRTNSRPSAGDALCELSEENEGGDGEKPKPKSRVFTFMEQIKPLEEEGCISAWSKAQMAETPTLLPNLKFHDLVFGHDLGSGAFGSVKYARLIDKAKTRSLWPEYAVKIISTERIKEMGYEASVQREVAVLRVLSHPGVARLVSSFRFREGVYLVLEYASNGDLHSLLQKNGSIDHDSTRFVMGEVVAALSSIHDLDLVYGDLKPENIVITESGHVKLTDFGGCRPVTPKAKKMVECAARNLLNDLRDGGWKSEKMSESAAMDADQFSENGEDEGGENNGLQHDPRVEGTTAYLPPEVVLGGRPTFEADSWALGCVIYQCLSGRPPLLEADEASTRNRIVSFSADKAQQSDDRMKLFGDAHALSIEATARNLILTLLNRQAEERPSMQRVAEDEFFIGSGFDVFTLYTQTAPSLDVGDVSPVADAQWTRRQFSSIWAPQPHAYDISLDPSGGKQPNISDTCKAPIAEGQEARSFFSRSTNPFDMADMPENSLPPIPSKSIAEE